MFSFLFSRRSLLLLLNCLWWAFVQEMHQNIPHKSLIFDYGRTFYQKILHRNSCRYNQRIFWYHYFFGWRSGPMRNSRLNLMILQENTGNGKSGLIFGSISPEDISGMSKLCTFLKDKMLCFHLIVIYMKSSVFENRRKF